EQIRRQEAAVEELNTRARRQRRLDGPAGSNVRGVLRDVVRQIRAEMLDVESRLLERVKAGDEPLDPRMPRYQHGLAITWHEPPPCAAAARARSAADPARDSAARSSPPARQGRRKPER